MTNKAIPSPEMLRKLLRYKPESGKLLWRKRTPDLFSTSRYTATAHCQTWNARYSGKEAFTALNKGYRVGAIFGKIYSAHRVIWAIVNDKWPLEQIDHINHDRADNHVENLRAVHANENNKNVSLQKNNISGTNGVCWNGNRKKWQVRIGTNGKCEHIGLFSTIEEAIAARVAANKKYGFHANHGKEL